MSYRREIRSSVVSSQIANLLPKDEFVTLDFTISKVCVAHFIHVITVQCDYIYVGKHHQPKC